MAKRVSGTGRIISASESNGLVIAIPHMDGKIHVPISALPNGVIGWKVHDHASVTADALPSDQYTQNMRYQAVPGSVKKVHSAKIVEDIGVIAKMDEKSGQFGFINVNDGSTVFFTASVVRPDAKDITSTFKVNQVVRFRAIEQPANKSARWRAVAVCHKKYLLSALFDSAKSVSKRQTESNKFSWGSLSNTDDSNRSPWETSMIPIDHLGERRRFQSIALGNTDDSNRSPWETSMALSNIDDSNRSPWETPMIPIDRHDVMQRRERREEEQMEMEMIPVPLRALNPSFNLCPIETKTIPMAIQPMNSSFTLCPIEMKTTKMETIPMPIQPLNSSFTLCPIETKTTKWMNEVEENWRAMFQEADMYTLNVQSIISIAHCLTDGEPCAACLSTHLE